MDRLASTSVATWLHLLKLWRKPRSRSDISRYLRLKPAAMRSDGSSVRNAPCRQHPPPRGRLRPDRGPGQRPGPGRSSTARWSPCCRRPRARPRPSSATAPRPTRSPRKTRRGCARCSSRSLNRLNQTRDSHPQRDRLHSQLDRHLRQRPHLGTTSAPTGRPPPTTSRSPRRSPGRGWTVRKGRIVRASSRRRTARSTRATARLAVSVDQRTARRRGPASSSRPPAGAFSGITDAAGCAVFADLPAATTR